jgi:hypothetical protein
MAKTDLLKITLIGKKRNWRGKRIQTWPMMPRRASALVRELLTYS